jgi:hypothetical protein
MTRLLLLCQEQVVGSSFLNSSIRALPIQYLIIADDRLTRKCGSESTCTDFIQTERLFTDYSVTIPLLLHARKIFMDYFLRPRVRAVCRR